MEVLAFFHSVNLRSPPTEVSDVATTVTHTTLILPVDEIFIVYFRSVYSCSFMGDTYFLHLVFNYPLLFILMTALVRYLTSPVLKNKVKSVL